MSSPQPVDWGALLDGTGQPFLRIRRVLMRIPSGPRCKMCAAPFHGPGAPLMRAIGRQPWGKNPRFCGHCFEMMGAHRGGAEIELSLLFADVRGSTGIAERMSPTDFRTLLNRFYQTAVKILVERDAVVDKFVGDEVVALFIPGIAGKGHASAAIDAGRELLRETGHGAPGGPWAPIGVGIHTGRAYVGSVGDGEVSDFTALGDVVNTTARLASAAGAGEILVTDAAAAAAGLPDAGLERRHLDVRGRSEPVDVVVVKAAAEAGAAP